MSEVLVDVEDLVVEYVTDGYAVRPLDHFAMQARSGELLALLGPSGSGKTTLLSVLSGMVPATSGRVVVAGRDVGSLSSREMEDYRRHTIGIVFQGFNLLPSLTALENVAAPLLLAGVTRAEALARARVALDEVELSDRADHRPNRMSGGQQQRVAVARALIGEPDVILADEPTANLDVISAEAVVRLFRRLRSAGRAIVISTHDTRLIPVADRVVEMAKGPSEAEHVDLERHFTDGEVLFRQGDDSDYVWMINSGAVEVVREYADGSEERVTVIEAGNYVGELGPLTGFPRSATVRAVADGSAELLTPHEFKARSSRVVRPD